MMDYRVGDALMVLPTIETASVDAVITDPPYSSGGIMRADRQIRTSDKYRNTGSVSELPEFSGDSRPQLAYQWWSTVWMVDALRVTRPAGWLMVFSDWRQLPATMLAVDAAGWITRGVVVWIKTAGRPLAGRFKNSAEYIVTATNGHHALDFDGGVYPDGWWRGSAPSDRVHITQKPVELMRHLMTVVPEGGTVLDPFAGSGTTGEAAMLEGLDFIGVDIAAEWVEYAHDRVAQLPLFSRSGTWTDQHEEES